MANAADELREHLDRTRTFYNGVKGRGCWYDRPPYTWPDEVAKALRRPTDWQFIRALGKVYQPVKRTKEMAERWRREDRLARNDGVSD